MIINKDVIQHIKAVESKLKEELNFDVYNSDHLVLLLNVGKCENILAECVLNKYCISIYHKYILPMYYYLEFTNNFLTLGCFSSYINKDVDYCKEMVNTGKQILNTIN